MQSRRVSGSGLALLGFACLCAVVAARAADLESPPEEVDAHELAARAADVMLGERTFLEAKMTIRSRHPSRERELRFHRFSDRSRKRSMLRILAPEIDRGTGYLERHPNLWMYLPRVERTMRIPPSMMRKPWMGSDFTNDDLVNHSSEVEDYDHRLLGVDPQPDVAPDLRAYVVEYAPSGDSPVVWPKIVVWIEVEHATTLRREFYDGEGELVRVMHFGGIGEVQGRHFPHIWTVWPMREEGRETRIDVEQIRFDADIDGSVFSTQHLKAGAAP
jgi:outer membrane lipoprotein-sorting protein